MTHMTGGDATVAAQMYDKVAKADLPQQLVLTATRGVILARGPAGVPLLVEQLQSADKHHFYLGLAVARELPGPEATAAIVAEVSHASPEKQRAIDPGLGRSRRCQCRTAGRKGGTHRFGCRAKASPSGIGSLR